MESKTLFIFLLYNIALILAVVGIITSLIPGLFIWFRVIACIYVPIILIAFGLLLQLYFKEKE